MRSFLAKAAAFVAAGSLVVTSLVGCGPKEPTNAQELYESYSKIENNDNFNMDMTYDLEMSLGDNTIPMSIGMNVDIAGTDAHGTMTVEAMGQSSDMEVYMEKNGDKYEQYMGQKAEDGSTGTWIKSEAKSSLASSVEVDASQFESAEFKKTDDGYQITLSGEQLKDMAGQMGDLESVLGKDVAAAMDDALKDATATYTFNKEYQLTGMDMDFSFTYSGEDLKGMSLTAKCTLKAVLSNHGKVDAATVKVPEDVKAAATDTTSLTEGLAVDSAAETTKEQTETEKTEDTAKEQTEQTEQTEAVKDAA